MGKLKILQLFPPVLNGGTQQYIFRNLKYLDKDKFEVDLLTQCRELCTSAEYKRYGFGIKLLPGIASQGREAFDNEVRLILKEGYDVIHLHTNIWTGLRLEELAMDALVPKVIVHSHNAGMVRGKDETDELNEKKQALHNACRNAISPAYATDFCACSCLAADWLYGDNVPHDKVQILHNAIEPERFGFQNQKRREIRERLGVEELFLIGHMGRYSYEKNHEFLLEVFKNVYDRNPKVRLLLIGEGELKEQIVKKAEAYDIKTAILFIEWSDSPQDYYQAMDLFVLPSRFEGLSLGLIEAQAAGLKCIVSDAVPDEAMITEQAIRVPLDFHLWTERILDMMQPYERADMREVIADKGYDIHAEIKKIEELYQ